MQERVLLLASHGGLAEGMRDTAAMVLGEFPCEVRTYSLLPGMNAQDAVATLREEVERHPQTEFVILTDVYGASVFTAFCQLLRYSNVRLFCGMNVAMVLSLLIEHSAGLDGDGALAVQETAREGVRYMTAGDLLGGVQAEEPEDF